MSQDRPHVLVIDDEVGIREMLTYELSMEGFEVTCAPTGMAAVEMMKSHKFDVAVSDFKMPGMTGAETVAALKALDPDLEVIVATGYATAENAIECMKSGAYDLIEKPYDVSDLKRLLEAAMVKTHLDTVAALHKASAALLAALSRGSLPQEAVNAAAGILPSTGVILVIMRAEGASMYRSPSLAGIGEDLLLSVGGTGLNASEPVRLPEPGLLETLKDSGGRELGGAVVCPLRTYTGPFGALGFLRDVSQPGFTTHEMHAATVFALEVALALENARLRNGGQLS